MTILYRDSFLNPKSCPDFLGIQEMAAADRRPPKPLSTVVQPIY